MLEANIIKDIKSNGLLIQRLKQQVLRADSEFVG
jgi:hypothetical protein